MADLSVEFAGLKFKNPVFASSGPITDTIATVEKCCKGGAGAVINKTVTVLDKLRVYPRPHDYSLTKFGRGLDQNCLGAAKLVADESPEEWARDVLPGMLEVCDKHNVVYIQSILGDGGDIPSWVEMAQMMVDRGAPALELNYSCPHSSAVVPNTGAQLGMNPENAAEVTAAVRKAVNVPIFCKMTSRNEEVDKVAAACCQAGADGISVFNNQTGLWVDVENLSYYGGIPATVWGWGGRFMQPIALLKTVKVHQNPGVTCPVYGGTGIWTWDDALRFILLGNHAVQLQIAVMDQGYDLFKKITDGIEEFMDRKGIKNLEEIRGKVLHQLLPNNQLTNNPRGDVIVNVIEDKCVGCGRCRSCMWGVLDVVDGKAKKVQPELCHGCGWCMSLCRSNALEIIKKSGEVICRY